MTAVALRAPRALKVSLRTMGIAAAIAFAVAGTIAEFSWIVEQFA